MKEGLVVRPRQEAQLTEGPRLPIRTNRSEWKSMRSSLASFLKSNCKYLLDRISRMVKMRDRTSSGLMGEMLFKKVDSTSKEGQQMMQKLLQKNKLINKSILIINKLAKWPFSEGNSWRRILSSLEIFTVLLKKNFRRKWDFVSLYLFIFKLIVMFL